MEIRMSGCPQSSFLLPSCVCVCIFGGVGWVGVRGLGKLGVHDFKNILWLLKRKTGFIFEQRLQLSVLFKVGNGFPEVPFPRVSVV